MSRANTPLSTPCIEATGAPRGGSNGKNYRSTLVAERLHGEVYAHRNAWIRAHAGQPIPAGMFICHRCDNPPCIEPTHLFLGSRIDNMRDASQKGRLVGNTRAQGTLSPASKLTEDQVREIRTRYGPPRGKGRRSEHIGKVTTIALATEYGVDVALIGRIVNRLRWTHVA